MQERELNLTEEDMGFDDLGGSKEEPHADAPGNALEGEGKDSNQRRISIEEEKIPPIAVEVIIADNVQLDIDNIETHKSNIVEQIREERGKYSDILHPTEGEKIEVRLQEGGKNLASIRYTGSKTSRITVSRRQVLARDGSISISLADPTEGFKIVDGQLMLNPDVVGAEVFHHVGHVYRAEKGKVRRRYFPLWCDELGDDARFLSAEVADREEKLGYEEALWDIDAFPWYPDRYMPSEIEISAHDVAKRVIRTAENLIAEGYTRELVSRKMLLFAFDYEPPVPLIGTLADIAAFSGDPIGVKRLEIENRVRTELGQAPLPERDRAFPQPDGVFNLYSETDLKKLSKETGLSEPRLRELLSVLGGHDSKEFHGPFRSLVDAAEGVMENLENKKALVDMALLKVELFIRAKCDPGIGKGGKRSEAFAALGGLEKKYNHIVYAYEGIGFAGSGPLTPEGIKEAIRNYHLAKIERLMQFREVVSEPGEKEVIDSYAAHLEALDKNRARIVDIQAKMKQDLVEYMPISGKFSGKAYPNEIARLCDPDELKGELGLTDKDKDRPAVEGAF